MLQLTPYLSFNGRCEEGFKFYEKHLGGKITFMARYGESPGHENMPPEWSKRIMHVTLAVGDRLLQGADAPGPYEKPQGFSISLGMNDAAEAERIFKALEENGKALEENGVVGMPLQETYWAARFGIVTDRFGTPWLINCEKPAA